jgi:type II secretory pathway component GspD/PulD (secretin)
MTLAAKGAGGAGTTADGISAILQALDTVGKTEILSEPRVTLLNNTVANIQAGQSESYVDSYTVSQTTSGTTVAATTNSVQGGVNLQLIASIVGDDIYLNVTPVISTIDQIRSISLGSSGIIEAPDTSSKSISSMVKVKEGMTAVIGGLITKNNVVTSSGVPFLDKLPFGIGKNLFTYQTKNNDRTELVIFITPKRG